MIKNYCDRCGEEIKGTPIKILPTSGTKLSADELNELLPLKEPLREKCFCKECLAEIVDFALNKNTCDECVEQIMEEKSMLQGAGRIIQEECLYESGRYIIPLQPIEPELISKYRKAVKKYGVPKRCTVMPPLGERSEEDITIWAGVDLAGSKDCTTAINYRVPVEEIAKVMRAIREECQSQDRKEQEQ